MSKLWGPQLMNTDKVPATWIRSDNACRVTNPRNTLADLYIYLIRTSFIETIDTVPAQQSCSEVVLCCFAQSYKTIPPKCRQNWFHKNAKTTVPTESKQAQAKKKILTIFSPSTWTCTLARNNIISKSQRFK